MRLRVWLRSVPGPYEQYDGHVDVTVRDSTDDDDIKTEAFRAAINQLRRTAFPDRSWSMWRFVRCEML